MQFQNDLIIGKEAEEKILNQIRKKYPLAFGIEGKHKAYDIFIPEIDSGVEVKNDLQSEKTGNVFIEISWRGEPSGLMATRSKYWAYCIGLNCIWIKTESIMALIIESDVQLRTFVPKKESGTVQGYLIKTKLLEKYSCAT